MKTLTFISALALTSAFTVNAHAEASNLKKAERVATFSTAAVVGGIAGGPVGMMIGAIGGAYLANQSQKAEDSMEVAQERIETLEVAVTTQASDISELEDRVAKKLEFQVMFPTGGDELSFQDMQRISSLAKYLKKNPELQVRLDGHADPRGTDEYNNVLSAERAKSVADALTTLGIAQDRIHTYFHGSDFAVIDNKNQDAYALERRVHIEVYSDSSEEVASTN